MATFAQLKTRVEGYLIDRVTFTDNLIGDWINKAVREAEERHNYQHMRARLEATTTVDTRLLVAKPSDWKEPQRAAPWFLRNDGSTKEMAWSVPMQVRRQFAEGDTDDDGDPELLVEAEDDVNNLLVYPYPDGGSDYVDGEYRIKVPYWAFSADLVNDGDTNWFTDNAEWFLTFYAAAEGFLANRDTQEATIYLERAEAERQKTVRVSKRTQAKGPRTLVPSTRVFNRGRRPPKKL